MARSAPLDSLVEETGPKASQRPLQSPASDTKSLNPQKWKRETEQQLSSPSRKRPRTSCPSPSVQEIDPVTYWTQTYHWPRGCFHEGREMSHLFARKKSATPSLSRKRSDSESDTPIPSTPSDQKPRQVKNAPYQDPRYKILLEAKGSFLGKYIGQDEEGPTAESKKTSKSLLEAEQKVPEHSLFEDDFFEGTCAMITDRNEAKVIQDIARLIVPSVESLTTRGAKHLRCLIESVNEGWNNSIPLITPRPQPDYSVGFTRSAFTETQLQKLQPFLGDLYGNSFFAATWYLCFPFFSSEVKCGAAALDAADRQNAHSMTLAVRGVVELFRLVKREQELHREILAFSISHDNKIVRIYGHYPVLDGKKTTFYRHPIHDFNFTALDGKEKWTAYRFTRNVYDIWMPAHLKRLCSAIDALPLNIHFEGPGGSELHFPSSSGLSEALKRDHFSDSGIPGDNEPRLLGPQEVTPETSVTQTPGQAASKRPKKG